MVRLLNPSFLQKKTLQFLILGVYYKSSVGDTVYPQVEMTVLPHQFILREVFYDNISKRSWIRL